MQDQHAGQIYEGITVRVAGAYLDPAKKLLCDECYAAFTAKHEDSMEVLIMCEACYEVIPRMQREKEEMGALVFSIAGGSALGTVLSCGD